jgi:hypothetical protein
MLETKLRPDGAPPRLMIILEDEDGVWHDGRGRIIDPSTVSGPLRIIRLIKEVTGSHEADRLEEPCG